MAAILFDTDFNFDPIYLMNPIAFWFHKTLGIFTLHLHRLILSHHLY